METELARAINDNNLEIVDENVSMFITPNILKNIARTKAELDDLEKQSLIEIIGKFNSFEKSFNNYLNENIVDEKTASLIILFIENIKEKFKAFYRYNIYLEFEKRSAKSLQKIKNSINLIAGSTNDYNEQLRLIKNKGLVDSFNEAHYKYKELKKGFKYQNKKLDGLVKKYDFADFIFLLDSEIEKLEETANLIYIQDSLKEMIRSWYQRLNQLVEEKIYIINECQKKYDNYCLKYGVKEKKKTPEESVIALLELFNPNLNIVYDGKKLFISDVRNLNLPNGFTYNREKEIIEGQDWEQKIKIKVAHDYNRTDMLVNIQAKNPHVQLYLDKINNKSVIVSEVDIEKLTLPMGFSYEKDVETGEIIISNKKSGANKVVSFNYYKLPKEELVHQEKIVAPRELMDENEDQDLSFDFSKQKVARHLKKEEKFKERRIAKGLLKVSSHLVVGTTLTIAHGGIILGKGLSRITKNISQCVDILIGKCALASKKVKDDEYKKVGSSITELRTMNKESKEQVKDLDAQIIAVEKQKLMRRKEQIMEIKSNESQTFDLEDILNEYRGR